MVRHLFFSICVLAPTAALAQPVGYSLAGSELNRFDLTTGTVLETRTLTGPSDSVAMTQLPSGDLLSLQRDGDLWRIDPVAGTSSHLGATGITFSEGAGLTQDACGTVWLADDSNLYTVDPATGSTNLVVPLTARINALTSRGTELLGLSGTGVTYLSRIDPATGTVETFGDFAPSGYLQGLDFDAEGRLWGVAAATAPFGYYVTFELDPEAGGVIQRNQFPVGFGVFRGNLALSQPEGFCTTIADVPVSSVSLWFLVLALGVAGAMRSRVV